MTHRLAVAFAAALLAASPVLAQMTPSRELELGGGWFQDNPLDVDDISALASGPSVDLARTTWRNERTGVAMGVTSILGTQQSRWRNQDVYLHVTWRWRWENVDRRGFFHVGVGSGPLLSREGPPIVEVYNRQRRVPGEVNVECSGIHYQSGGMCNSIGVHTAEPLDMHIVELDWPDGDDEVTDLIYGGVGPTHLLGCVEMPRRFGLDLRVGWRHRIRRGSDSGDIFPQYRPLTTGLEQETLRCHAVAGSER